MRSWSPYLLFLFLHVLCMYLNVHVCMSVWRPAADVTSLLWAPSTLLFEKANLSLSWRSPILLDWLAPILSNPLFLPPQCWNYRRVLFCLASEEVTGGSKLRSAHFQAFLRMSCLPGSPRYPVLVRLCSTSGITMILTSCAFAHSLAIYKVFEIVPDTRKCSINTVLITVSFILWRL